MAIDTLETATPAIATPVDTPATPAIATPVAQPRSRRALLAAALGGLGGLFASRLGAPGPAAAAAGDPLLIGNTANTAGTANTSLTTASAGTALLVTQNGSGTALRGSAVGPGSIAGFFTAANGTGISGVTANPNTYGVFGSNDGSGGTGGAIRANGKNNNGLVASTAGATKVALKATNSAVDGTVALFENTSGGSGLSAGPALRAYTAGGSNADVHPSGAYEDAAGEFAGPNGVIGASPAGGFGVVGTSPSGSGVAGQSSSGSGVAGFSSSGSGVDGYSSSGYGVVGGSSSSVGVYGNSSGLDGYGVFGNSSGGFGSGVAGYSLDGYGVFGNSPSGFGVYGYSTTGNAGYFDGPLYAASLDAGSASATVKAFRIDHPGDPAGKILMHSCVESNERLTVYAGTVTTDAAGEATVELPGYFSALNRDLRYQLTPLADARAWVKREVKGNRFTLATSEPGTKVCWQVSGVRQDAYAKAHPLVVESVKTGKEKGKYLNPVEHGQPESKGVDYELRQQARRAARRQAAAPPTPALPGGSPML